MCLRFSFSVPNFRNFAQGTTPTEGVEAQSDEVSWWAAGKRYGFPPTLCDMCMRLHQTTATSAALERQLSTLKLSYGTLRTRLGVQRARKLAFVQRSVNGTLESPPDEEEI